MMKLFGTIALLGISFRVKFLKKRGMSNKTSDIFWIEAIKANFLLLVTLKPWKYQYRE